MGYAHGALLKDKAQEMLNSVWSYLELQVVGNYMYCGEVFLCTTATVSAGRSDKWYSPLLSSMVS